MKIIGIDLGTSNTYMYASTMAANDFPAQPVSPKPVIISPISDENGSIASVVMYEDGKPCLAGNIAESEFYANLAARPRRHMASQFKPEIARKDPHAMRAMTDFLSLLKNALPEALLDPETRVYVGMPSLSREDFSINLSLCFTEADWPKPFFVRESDAALVSCLQSGVLAIEDLDSKCLILDFGGGTCDFTSVEKLDALQNGGDILYGGRLFDDLFFQIFCRHNARFAAEASRSPYAWYVHWIECRKQKEIFSDFMNTSADNGENGVSGCSMHAIWYDSGGARHDAFVHNYDRDSFVRDAENYQASPELLEIVQDYKKRGGLGEQARDILENRQVGLISWLRSLLEKVGQRMAVSKIILTGGSARWFFVREIAHSVFPAAQTAQSVRGYEDIAFGLALFPQLDQSHARVQQLLDRQLDIFCTELTDKAWAIVDKQTSGIARLCAERIVSRDVLPVLESAHEKSMTAEELEKNFSENIKNDTSLLEIVKEKSEALARELQNELNYSFRAWLKQNGVMLMPNFIFPVRGMEENFFKEVSISITRLDSLNIMKFTLTRILPVIAATTAAFAIAHTAEPVSTIIGGSVALGGTWLAAKTAPAFLAKRKLPKILLNEKNRKKIVEKNRIYIEKEIKKSLEHSQASIFQDMKKNIRQSLLSMLGKLTILNQVKTG